MSFSRRDFIKSLGASAILAGCGSNNKEDQGSNSGSSNQSGYAPNVTRAYFPNQYFARKRTTDSYGYVDLSDNFEKDAPDYLYLVYMKDNYGRYLSDIEVSVFDDFVFGTKVLMARDPNKNYLPSAGIPDPFGDSGYLRNRLIDSDGIYNFLTMIQSFSDFSKMRLSLDAFPSWDPRDMDDLPGYIYFGDWSFEDLKNTTQVLETASLIFTFVAPNPATAFAYSVLSKTDFVLDNLESLLNFMDLSIEGFSINLDQEFSIYASPFDFNMVFFPSWMSDRNSSQDIKDLVPIQPGNYWDYGSEGKRKVKGLEYVKGKDLTVVEAGGVEEFWGFRNDVLSFYGIRDPSVGEIFFEPEISLGDSFVRRGNVYGRSSSIVSPQNPDVRGTISERFEVVGLENVIASGKPYGDCFKIREDFDIDISGPGGTARDFGSSDHWYAKHTGQVKQTFNGRTVELQEADVTGNNLPDSSTGLRTLRSTNDQDDSFSKRLVNSIKRLRQ